MSDNLKKAMILRDLMAKVTPEWAKGGKLWVGIAHDVRFSKKRAPYLQHPKQPGPDMVAAISPAAFQLPDAAWAELERRLRPKKQGWA